MKKNREYVQFLGNENLQEVLDFAVGAVASIEDDGNRLLVVTSSGRRELKKGDFLYKVDNEFVTSTPDDERLQLKKLRRELIQKHLEGWYGSEKSSIRYYFESGNVSGSLYTAIEKMMEEYRESDLSDNT